MLISPASKIAGNLHFSGDKSISHRLVLVSLLLNGTMSLQNLAECDDVKSSLEIVQSLGVEVLRSGKNIKLTNQQDVSSDKHSSNKHSFDKHVTTLDCGNSGTTARLLSGILAARPGCYRLTGDASLSRRPMQRVIEPLEQMGAVIRCDNGLTLPLLVTGQKCLTPITYVNKLSSAQVKSAILFAALNSHGTTAINEPFPSRDHSERLLKYMGVPGKFSPGHVEIIGPAKLNGNYTFTIPGDISSAAFFAIGAAIFPGSQIVLENVLLNPLRTKFLEVLQRMGCEIIIKPGTTKWEPSGSILITGKKLHGTEITASEIPALIDELPAIAVAMAFADGPSCVKGAAELRNKETDRIRDLISQFKKLGIKCDEQPDGFSIAGSSLINEHHSVDSFGDHRLAMAFALLACRSQKGLSINNSECVNISFPGFFEILQTCSK